MKRKPLAARPSPPPAREAHANLEALRARTRPIPPPIPLSEPTLTTAIHLPRRTHELLRRLATERAIRNGGRASVSGVLVALVEAQRAALEAELAGKG